MAAMKINLMKCMHTVNINVIGGYAYTYKKKFNMKICHTKVTQIHVHVCAMCNMYLSNALQEGDLCDGVSLLSQHQIELVDLAVRLEDAVDQTIQSSPEGSLPRC